MRLLALVVGFVAGRVTRPRELPPHVIDRIARAVAERELLADAWADLADERIEEAVEEWRA